MELGRNRLRRSGTLRGIVAVRVARLTDSMLIWTFGAPVRLCSVVVSQPSQAHPHRFTLHPLLIGDWRVVFCSP